MYKLNILKHIDILVDGQFEKNKKDLNLLWRGSSNQKILSVQDSLIQGVEVEIEP